MAYEMNDQREADRPAWHEESTQRSSVMSPALIGLLIVIAVCAIFFVRNPDEVALDFMFWEATTTVRWLIIVSIGLGILLDRFASMMWRRRRKRKLREKLND